MVTLYRSFMRWCDGVPSSTLPLDDFVPPLRGKTIDNVKVFKQVLRESFRENIPNDGGPISLTGRIQEGLDGLRQLNQLQPEIMAFNRQWGESIQKQQKQQAQQRLVVLSTTDEKNDNAAAFVEHEYVQKRLNAVKWLPKVEDCKPRSLEIDKDKKFPMFPLQGALFHADTILDKKDAMEEFVDDKLLPLPMFTPQQDIPVPGAEVPLQIFEPRVCGTTIYCTILVLSCDGRDGLDLI